MKALILLTTILLMSLYPKSKSQTLDVQIPKPQVQLLVLPPSTTPLTFADRHLEAVYPVIQTFKARITSDPLNVTATWTGPDVCRYTGFYCGAPPDNKSATAVASVDFNGFGLSSPSIAGFLDRLPDIAIFHANSNDFSGPFPQNIGRLRYLHELDVSNNKFSGPFPFSVLGKLGLIYLDIRFNSFSGPVPREVFTRGIDFLFLNNNDFATRFPETIRPDKDLACLTLANNKFYGPIPRGISRALSGLSEILLLNNSITGCLPHELGLLRESVVFDASSNDLTGPLPSSLGCLKNLEVLNLGGNKLYGNIPEGICRMGKLANISLSDNYFTQAGPECTCLIKKGVLDVGRNCISGLGLQRPEAECAAFFARPHTCPNTDAYSKVPCSIV